MQVDRRPKGSLGIRLHQMGEHRVQKRKIDEPGQRADVDDNVGMVADPSLEIGEQDGRAPGNVADAIGVGRHETSDLETVARKQRHTPSG